MLYKGGLIAEAELNKGLREIESCIKDPAGKRILKVRPLLDIVQYVFILSSLVCAIASEERFRRASRCCRPLESNLSVIAHVLTKRRNLEELSIVLEISWQPISDYVNWMNSSSLPSPGMQSDISVTSSHSSSFTNLTGIEGETLDDAPSCSLTDHEKHQHPEISTQLITLDSFLPVVKVLKGLTKEKNSGYVSRIDFALQPDWLTK
jgi:hypothetical protein